MNFKVKPRGGQGQRVKEDLAVGVVLEDVSVIRASIHDVMPSARKISTWGTRHGGGPMATSAVEWCQTQRV